MPAAPGEHMRQGGLRSPDHTGQIDIDLRLDILHRIQVFQPIQPPKTGIGKNHVQATKMLQHGS